MNELESNHWLSNERIGPAVAVWSRDVILVILSSRNRSPPSPWRVSNIFSLVRSGIVM